MTLSKGKVVRQSAFGTTRWSLVLTAGRGDASAAEVALEELCQIYWYPLYTYLRRRGYAETDAEDLTQEFFAWLLKRNWLSTADPQRGRFRSFLQVSFNRFLANEWDKTQAQKRGYGRTISLSWDDPESHCRWEPVDHLTPEQNYDRCWALTLLDQVLNRLMAEYADQGKSNLYEELKPCLLGEQATPSYAALGSKLGMTEGAVKVSVHRLRQKYRRTLQDEIAKTVVKPEEIEDEIRHLFSVLSRR